MAAFEWAGGGEWGGKPWSPELPTDSALAFYLFAAYLAAPQWLFPQVRRRECVRQRPAACILPLRARA